MTLIQIGDVDRLDSVIALEVGLDHILFRANTFEPYAVIIGQQKEARRAFLLGIPVPLPAIPGGLRPLTYPAPVDNLRDLIFAGPTGEPGRAWRSRYGTGTHRPCPAADDLRSGREVGDTNPGPEHNKDLLGPRNGEHELTALMHVPRRRTEHTERFKGREIDEFDRVDHL